jgi:hypothetical protein
MQPIYVGVAEALFSHLPEYDCKLESSMVDSEDRKKFLEERNLDLSTPTITASCKFDGRRCFGKKGIEPICFDHGGLMLINEMKITRKNAKADVELNYVLKDLQGKAVGLGFSKVVAEKTAEQWSVKKFEDTGAWDLRNAGGSN